MRKWIFIGASLWVYLICSSRSCSEGDSSWDARQLAWIEASRDSVVSQFDKESLSELDLSLLEEAAIQKIRDWWDCMKMLSDTSLALPFREHALMYARSLFVSSEEAEKMEKLVALRAKSVLDHPGIGKNLTPVPDSLYSGALICRWSESGSALSTAVVSADTIPFCVTRTLRIFGMDTFRLWNVFLGSLR